MKRDSTSSVQSAVGVRGSTDHLVVLIRVAIMISSWWRSTLLHPHLLLNIPACMPANLPTGDRQDSCKTTVTAAQGEGWITHHAALTIQGRVRERERGIPPVRCHRSKSCAARIPSGRSWKRGGGGGGGEAPESVRGITKNNMESRERDR